MSHMSDEAVWHSVSSLSYTHPEKFRNETVGPRRKQLENSLRQKILKEVMEKTENIPSNKNFSEYNDSFSTHGSQKPRGQVCMCSETHKKHPLYKDLGLSYWLYNMSVIQGVTSQPHPSLPFNRSANFSKPIKEVLDMPSVENARLQ